MMLVANLLFVLISISLLFVSALYIGGKFISTLRSSSRVNDFKQNSWHIIAAAFEVPIILFIILHILSRHGIVAKSWCNSISMGFVIGVFLGRFKEGGTPNFLMCGSMWRCFNVISSSVILYPYFVSQSFR